YQAPTCNGWEARSRSARKGTSDRVRILERSAHCVASRAQDAAYCQSDRLPDGNTCAQLRRPFLFLRLRPPLRPGFARPDGAQPLARWLRISSWKAFPLPREGSIRDEEQTSFTDASDLLFILRFLGSHQFVTSVNSNASLIGQRKDARFTQQCQSA